jgi:hypothetical protein
VSILQLWLVVGVPVLATVAALLVGGSPSRARAAVGLLVGLVLMFTATPGAGRVSATAVGLLAVLLVAGGRLEGPPPPDPRPARRHLTTAAGRDGA